MLRSSSKSPEIKAIPSSVSWTEHGPIWTSVNVSAQVHLEYCTYAYSGILSLFQELVVTRLRKPRCPPAWNWTRSSGWGSGRQPRINVRVDPSGKMTPAARQRWNWNAREAAPATGSTSIPGTAPTSMRTTMLGRSAPRVRSTRCMPVETFPAQFKDQMIEKSIYVSGRTRFDTHKQLFNSTESHSTPKNALKETPAPGTEPLYILLHKCYEVNID